MCIRDRERLEEARFDDEYSEDWMARLLESPLMSHLSATNIQRCFIELERVSKKAGEDVVLALSLIHISEPTRPY